MQKIYIDITNSYVREIVQKSFVRAYGSEIISSSKNEANVAVLDKLDELNDLQFKKIVFLGEMQNFKTIPIPINEISELSVCYDAHILTRRVHIKERYFERFDFTKEWNNLGYGRIEKVKSPFGIISWGKISDDFQVIAKIYNKNGDNLSDFAAIKNYKNSTMLWINRPVGLPDGHDWTIIEEFLENYRSDELISLKYKREIDSKYNGLVSFRIDCDENIESGRPLFELYKKYNIPFSLAIKTQQNITNESVKLMKEVIECGGSILSHSHTHISDWGGVGKSTWEFQKSLEVLAEYIPNYKIEYAVSPFHQNSIRAVSELENSGLKGFIGGIIHNDPEYLMARAGVVPFSKHLVSHSEQCMFHGDCYHDANNSIEIYKESFKSSFQAGYMFGYLDHPFSSYQYGWHTEEERLKVHEEFIIFLKTYNNIKYDNSINVLNGLRS